ncbi:MAG TPA: TetR/AcrR family transcriptional regulator [Acidimicrobiales bacterium]|nr:TetR/AcrR family transcriptional regulator [Acidimicrobiales bacterium]
MVSSPESDAAPFEPPWWRPPRPSRRRAPLTREQIIEAALRVIDAEGADALTVRRLGEELNTGSATLYWYISGKDELGELVYDHVMGALELPEPDPGRWEQQFKDLGRQRYRLLVRHNDLVRLAFGRVPVGPNMLRAIDWTVGLLRAAGLPDDAVRYAGPILSRYVDASVLQATTKGGPPPEAVGQYFASLPQAQFPNLTDLQRGPFELDTDARFEFGLDVLTRGLASFCGSASTRARRR